MNTIICCRCITFKEAWAMAFGPETLLIGIAIGIILPPIWNAWKRRHE